MLDKRCKELAVGHWGQQAGMFTRSSSNVVKKNSIKATAAAAVASSNNTPAAATVTITAAVSTSTAAQSTNSVVMKGVLKHQSCYGRGCYFNTTNNSVDSGGEKRAETNSKDIAATSNEEDSWVAELVKELDAVHIDVGASKVALIEQRRERYGKGVEQQLLTDAFQGTAIDATNTVMWQQEDIIASEQGLTYNEMWLNLDDEEEVSGI